MDCNKEEAIRAKSIAECRMQNKDFEGARKISMKAQGLFPDLEGISQILAVCEVHCAAATKMVGGTDWYAILQVEMTADESTIKKQYRKLALLLHPDKNKLAGAEGAFQQVGDAYKILSDPAKRSQYDMIRRGNFTGLSLNHAARQSYKPSAKKQPGPGVLKMASKSNFAHFNGLKKDPSFPFSGARGFWTMCPFCNIKFQSHQNILSKQVRCKKCFNSFVAHDFKAQGEPTTENSEMDGNSAPLTGTKTIDASTMEFQRAKPDDSAFNQGTKPEHSHEFFGEPNNDIEDGKLEDDLINSNNIKFQEVQLEPIHDGEKVGKPLARQRNNSRNEVNRVVETSVDRTNSLRRSKRHKKNVTCDEVQDSCMDSEPPSNKLRQGPKQVDTVQTNNAFARVVADADREENGNSHIHSEFNAEILSCPAPEFSNFEDERCESKFAVDQIWALYDNIDGMPRLYARVRKVYSRGFKLQLSWLEKDPRSIAEMKWCEQGLPVACGSFKLGKSFCTQERQTFSHLVPWRKGIRRNSYVIFPRKGEIWALFSNWDIRWSSKPDNQRVYKYEVVEVVSDFGVDGISVIRLAKIKEFMALFVRAADTKESLLEIPAKDALKFSHRIPACRMTGKEEDGIPEGAFELDCASLPADFKANIASINIKVTKSGTRNDGSACFNSITKENKISPPKMEDGFEPIEPNGMKKMNDTSDSANANSNKNQHSPPLSQKDQESEKVTLVSEVGAEADNTAPTSSLCFEYPESEFYDFEGDRLMEKFERGQIWAFYCDIDKFPKYYGRIRGIDRENNQVKVRWLVVYPALDEDEDKPPPACGVFRAIKETCTMDSVETFSHLVKVKPSAKGHYYIFPDVGEVWAVFRNWNASWSAHERRNIEFDIVEISASDGSGIKALPLTKVNGYVSVFCRESEGDDSVKLISLDECLKFSHRIPAYQITKEMDSSSSYWELDPAAVPTVFLT